MDSKIEEEISTIANKYGLKPKERFGDVIAENTNKENLQKIIE